MNNAVACGPHCDSIHAFSSNTGTSRAAIDFVESSRRLPRRGECSQCGSGGADDRSGWKHGDVYHVVSAPDETSRIWEYPTKRGKQEVSIRITHGLTHRQAVSLELTQPEEWAGAAQNFYSHTAASPSKPGIPPPLSQFRLSQHFWDTHPCASAAAAAAQHHLEYFCCTGLSCHHLYVTWMDIFIWNNSWPYKM